MRTYMDKNSHMIACDDNGVPLNLFDQQRKIADGAMLYENVRLLGSWIKENCEVGVTCEECGRHLTNKEFEDHKEACRLLQN